MGSNQLSIRPGAPGVRGAACAVCPRARASACRRGCESSSSRNGASTGQTFTRSAAEIRRSGFDGMSTVASPLQAQVVEWLFEPGDTMRAGDLLVVLEAIHAEGSLTRAARRLNLSQPA